MHSVNLSYAVNIPACVLGLLEALLFWIITGVVVVVLLALAWWSSGHRWKVDTRGRNPEGRQAIDRARSESPFRSLGGGPPGGAGPGSF